MEIMLNETLLIEYLSWMTIFFGVILTFVLLFIRTPYGRYGSASWGPLMNAQLAWFLQELPALIIPVLAVFWPDASKVGNSPNKILLCAYILHYCQRALIYPFLIKGGKPTPLSIFLLAIIFTSYNGYIQGRSLTKYADYPEGWHTSRTFIIGMVLFALGMVINIHSDHILRNLRKPGETGYKIPQGGMFEYVSGANFFGELLEWTGFALASQSLVALSFCVFAWTNIGPRAVHHHRWYHEKFEDYPKNRRALIPFLF